MKERVSNNITSSNEFVAGNVYDKYGTKNPIAKLMMNGFFQDFRSIISSLKFNNILEVGCGEGHLLNQLKCENKESPISMYGTDLSSEIIKQAKNMYRSLSFFVSSVYDIPFKKNSFDLVVASEVLEHIEDPVKGIEAIKEISCKYCLFSVPREPVWRALNMCRGQYLKQLGNTPGHINHWSKRGVISLIKENGLLIEEVRTPFPWTMVLASIK